MTQQLKLQQKAKELLTNKTVDVVIGYGLSSDQPCLILVTDPADTEQLIWNDRCNQNLVTYLTRKEVRALGKAAIVAKGCDVKSLVVLELENQIDRNSMVVIGMECYGVQVLEPTAMNLTPSSTSSSTSSSSPSSTSSSLRMAAKCLSCEVNKPLNCDEVIECETIPANQSADTTKKYDRLNKLMAMNTDERLNYWKEEFSRCIKCYACRQSCPLCYCNVCVVDKNRPVRIDTSATLKGNFAWNILRAFHLAGRCVGCSACSDACPAGIDLDLLNLSLAKAAEENFNHKSGLNRSENLLIGTFSPDDHEEFIR
ncbi:MAG: 4Fe-4S dicluster domain-containing protein [Planctomycetaceae bacterium]|jgi:ferredoxin|nr:4Fe-4S dicluster domain-containing protein [Planctomycetaceae bacterium]